MRTILLFVIAILMCSSMALGQTQTPISADCAEAATLKKTLDNAQAKLADSPNLNKYRGANSKLAAPAKDEQRVVFMGDSITDFWDRPNSGGFFPGKPYVDRGISGQTTPQMLVRFRPDVIALKPKVVVILAGTNDISGNTDPMPLSATEDNLASMADLARANGIRVVLSSIMPVSDYGHGRDGKEINQTKGRPPAEILELNVWIKRYSAENGYVYLDYFSAMVDDKGMLKSNISDDGLHPNAKGYAVMSPLAEQAIATALVKK